MRQWWCVRWSNDGVLVWCLIVHVRNECVLSNAKLVQNWCIWYNCICVCTQTLHVFTIMTFLQLVKSNSRAQNCQVITSRKSAVPNKKKKDIKVTGGRAKVAKHIADNNGKPRLTNGFTLLLWATGQAYTIRGPMPKNKCLVIAVQYTKNSNNSKRHLTFCGTTDAFLRQWDNYGQSILPRHILLETTTRPRDSITQTQTQPNRARSKIS